MSKILLAEKLTNGALVTPTPAWLWNIMFCSKSCLVALLIRAILRGKFVMIAAARVQFVQSKIEQDMVFFKSHTRFPYEQQHRENFYVAIF